MCALEKRGKEGVGRERGCVWEGDERESEATASTWPMAVSVRGKAEVTSLEKYAAWQNAGCWTELQGRDSEPDYQQDQEPWSLRSPAKHKLFPASPEFVALSRCNRTFTDLS